MMTLWHDDRMLHRWQMIDCLVYFAFWTWRSIALVSSSSHNSPWKCQCLTVLHRFGWALVTCEWHCSMELSALAGMLQLLSSMWSLSPQQGGSCCHHNLTVCWTSHDRAISGPGLPTCCQFHWSQSSQIINNVPAPHLHLHLRLTPPLIQYISHWHCVALWTFSDDVMASKLLACAKSFFVRAANCGIKHD